MPLTPGTRLGPYEIRAPLGQGGMGEVYRAHDTRLKREVALKVLPAAFATDPDRLARFQREAELLASLNHPHIAAIYGLEQTDAGTALVLELVEGDTLADRIARGPLPLDEALLVAQQIAEALEAAHEQGVIHRDLKPANIKLKPRGALPPRAADVDVADCTVKVLDFGLAKLVEAGRAGVGSGAGALSRSPTISSPTLMTGVGMLLGTAAYMSPEQAAGKAIDPRTDIFSFGAVLYEMLAGRRAFQGDSTTEVLAAILKTDPDWKALPASTPESVRRLLRRCLERDRTQRLQAIGEARIVLSSPTAGERPPEPRRSRFVLASGWAVAAVFALTAAVASWRAFGPAPEAPRMVARFTVPWDTGGAPYPLGISVSPDGSRLAFTAGARSEIFVRELSEPEARVVPGTERSISPRFSPDGSVLLFTTQAGEIKSVPVAGGVAQVIVSNVGSNVGSLSSAFWGRDDRVLFGTSEGLMRVSSRGGAPETLVTIASHLQAGEDGLVLLPILLPAGKAVVYHVGKSSGVLDTAVLDLTTGTTKLLPTEVFPVDSSRFVVGAVLDHLLVSTPSGLMAVPFDEERLQVTGPPVIVLPDVFVVPRGFYSNLGISDSGTVAYYSGNLDSLAKYQLVWVDHAGVEQPIPAPVARYTRLRLSPHGDQIATMVIDERDRSNDVWIYQLPDGPLTRRTFDYGNIRTWTPDGRHLVVRLGAGGRTRLASVPADGSGAPVTLIAQTANQPEAMSPDGKVMIGSGGPDQRRVWLWSLGQGVLTGDQHQDYPNSLMDPPSVKGSFRFSPDGKWVAYQSNESGRFEVFVVPYPGPGAKRQVSIDGGTDPRWSRDGRELFYLNGTKMMAAAVETGPTFRVLGTPRMLFDYPGYLETAQYDVSPDGRRFLMARNAPTEPGQQVGQIQVIVNWLEELKTRLAR